MEPLLLQDALPPSIPLSLMCLHLHMPPFVFHTSLQSQFFMIFKRLLRSPCPYTPRQRRHLLSPTPPPDLFVSYFIKQYPGMEGFVFVSCGAPTAAGDVSPSAPTEWRRVIRWEVNTQLQTWHVHVSPSISHKKKKEQKQNIDDKGWLDKRLAAELVNISSSASPVPILTVFSLSLFFFFFFFFFKLKGQ